MRNALAAGELALATVLLIDAGLLMQNLLRLQQVHLGFQPQGLLTFQIAPPPARYPGVKAWTFYREMLDSLEALSGVRGAALPVDWRAVSPEYFRAMQIPLLRGRYFTDRDIPSAPRVTIVSQETATRFWGDDDPIGRDILLSGDRHFTVVGVCAACAMQP